MSAYVPFVAYGAFTLFESDNSYFAPYPFIHPLCCTFHRGQFVILTSVVHKGLEFPYHGSESTASVSASDFADSLLEFRHLFFCLSSYSCRSYHVAKVGALRIRHAAFTLCKQNLHHAHSSSALPCPLTLFCSPYSLLTWLHRHGTCHGEADALPPFAGMRRRKRTENLSSFSTFTRYARGSGGRGRWEHRRL